MSNSLTLISRRIISIDGNSTTLILRRSYQEPGQDHRDGDGRHTGRAHHQHVGQLVVMVGFVLQLAVRDQKLVFAGILGELEHFDVVAEFDLGRFPPPEEVAGIAALQAPDRLLRGDG